MCRNFRARLRSWAILAAIAAGHCFDPTDAQAVEIVWGADLGLNRSAVYGRDSEDRQALPLQIGSTFDSAFRGSGVEYWQGKIYASASQEYVMNVDGSGFMPSLNTPPHVSNAFGGFAQTLDGSATYYVDTQGERIIRDFEMPSEMTIVETDDLYLADIAIDELNGKIYWIAALDPHENGVIQRVNFDGTGLETLVDISDGLNPDYAPVFIELDAAAGKMYWSTLASFDIRRANLDGSDIEIVVEDAGHLGFALVVEPVPEPGTAVLLLAAGVFLLARRGRGCTCVLPVVR